jgi:transcriptional regulator with XRE-family HTH domain
MDDEQFRIALGQRLRELRKEHGYTQGEFAERIGLDGPALSRIENGQRGIDTLVLQRASAVLDVSMDAFFAQEQELALARSGDVDDPAMVEMLDWARTMQRNFDVVAAYADART